ncbi:type VII secretion integral membrane protein EccD [Mycolicibacterium arenosum]|uniref:Type VII secretion integral membrane protein EccD n=1 Tax=Mycolicibacterium arenosum TaxID=2952157 RepID=A0ABT1LXF8_9MYCO|nr:type VII secretion integral membrane protein EccD [Mycolicibacterium sp. CAU 1645]MCP9271566.1 type VII secretion integral membrane protein EccD [Mycolicibacterium sp. CAU 1645]
MTGFGELDRASSISAAPELIRIAVLADRTQLDVALPVDVPVAALLPDLVSLVRSRHGDEAEETSASPTWHRFWVVSRIDPVVTLAPDTTLREAGVSSGEVLRLTTQPALSPPTLHDDVVDAAARLNRTAHVGWSADSARWMGCAGLMAAGLVWVYFVAGEAFAGHRSVMVALAAVVVAATVGAAALAHRIYRRADVATALGWTIIPVVAALAWVAVHGRGSLALAAGAGSTILVLGVCRWVIGTGGWAFVACAVLLAAGLAGALGHAAGAGTSTVGAVTAVLGAFACSGTARLHRRRVSGTGDPGDTAPRLGAAFGESERITHPDTGLPTAETVWADVRAAERTRSAVSAGLTATVACGATAVLYAAPATWDRVSFAVLCATVLALTALTRRDRLQQAAFAVPAALIVMLATVRAQEGSTVMASAALVTLVVSAVAAAAGALADAGDATRARLRTAAAYLRYVTFAALIPVAVWVDGGLAVVGPT